MKLLLEKCPICEATISMNDKFCSRCHSRNIFAVNFLDTGEREKYKKTLDNYRHIWKELERLLIEKISFHQEKWHIDKHWAEIWQSVRDKASSLDFDEYSIIELSQLFLPRSETASEKTKQSKNTPKNNHYDFLKAPLQRQVANWVIELQNKNYSVIEWLNFVRSMGETSNYPELTEILQKEIQRQFLSYQTVSVDDTGNLHNHSRLYSKAFIENLRDEVELSLIRIPSGSFEMGSEDWKHTSPNHSVDISEFYLGVFEITQKQWEIVSQLPKIDLNLESHPSYFTGENLPVDSVSWLEATEFCQRLSKQTGRNYRLPTESEWEYAARAGSKTAFTFGKVITSALANHVGNLPSTEAVGSFAKNAFGLADMHGNVWEWCIDIWHKDYSDSSKPTDGSAWISGGDPANRVLRGGSWVNWASLCSSYERISENFNDEGKLNYIGFRIALDL